MGTRFRAVAAAYLLGLALPACGDPSDGFARLEEYPNRVFSATAWDTVHAFGPETVDDTTLVFPTGLVAWGKRLIIPEWPHATVRAFDLEGNGLWQFGRRGGGPGELEQMTDVAPTPWGTLWILDGKNLKIVEVDTAGALVRELPTRTLPAVPGTVLFLSSHTVLFGTQSPRAGRIVAGADSLEVEEVRPFLWADSVDRRYNLKVRVASDSATGRWVEALFHGPGFVTGVGDSITGRHRYIDVVPWARKGGPAVRAAGADSARYGAVEARAFGGEVYFLFGGRPRRQAHPAEPTRLVDVYGFDGAYRRSYLIPMDVHAFSILADGSFAVLGWHEEVFPRVYILRPAGV